MKLSRILPVVALTLGGCGAASPAAKTASTAGNRGATYVAMQGYSLLVDACDLTVADPKLAAVTAKCEELLPVAHDLIAEALLAVKNTQPVCSLAKAVETLSTLGLMVNLTTAEKAVLADADELAKGLAPFCPASVDAGGQ